MQCVQGMWQPVADDCCGHAWLAVQVTPERVRTLAGFTLQDAWQLTK